MSSNFFEDAICDKGSTRTMEAWPSFSNKADTVSQAIKSSAGVLHAIVVNATAAGTLTVYDNTAGSGTKIATLKASIVEGTYTYDLKFSNGLYVIPAAAMNVTYIYS